MFIKSLRSLFGLALTVLIVIALLVPTAAQPSFAQDANTITVDGSNIVSPVLKAAAQQYAAKSPDTKIDINVSGTSGGFEKLCAGTLDVNMAVRAVTDAEAAACQQKNVNFVELALGYDALIVAVNASSKVACLTTDQLNKVIGPSATGVNNWNAVDSTLGDVPISAVYSLAPDSQVSTLATSMVTGQKLRTDIQVVDPAAAGSPASVAAKVSSDVKSIGLLTFTEFNATQGQNLAIKALQMNNGGGCVDVSVPNIEEARYPGETLYLYVNAASLDRKPVNDFLTYVLSTDGRLAITSSGFTAASDTTYDRGTNYLTLKQTGRTFSRIQSVNVPATTAGTVTSDGSAEVFTALKAIGDAFSPRYTQIKFTPSGFGNDAGFQKLCANNIDMIGATRQPTDAEAAACQKANVQTIQLNLGATAVVVLVNTKNQAATCLTTDQLAKIFSSDSQGKVKKWSDADPKLGSNDLLLLTPDDGAPETDLLMTKIEPKVVAPLRRNDTTINTDPLYRAAATQNVDGAITYMNYSEFKTVTSKVQAVQIDAGKGCIDPTEANIKSGTYPLSEQLYVRLNLNTFSRPEIKAFVWYLLSDDSLAILAKQGLVGVDTASFTAAREIALTQFAATGATAVATAQATNALVIAPPQGTSAATAAAPQATSAATAAVPQATSAATAAAPQATSAATAAAQ